MGIFDKHTDWHIGLTGGANDTAPLHTPTLPLELSAWGSLSRAQIKAFSLFMSFIGLALLTWPIQSLILLSWTLGAVFLSLIVWRLGLVSAGVFIGLKNIFQRSYPRCDSDQLPVYTVMIALYREAEVAGQLASALRRLDWPTSKLDIMLLLEKDDAETLAAVRREIFPALTRIIVVPDGAPRTKPRALNYGLERAKGDLVCIFDAEDRPHPKQLRQAHAGFQRHSASYACLQAPLVADNSARGWLAAQWGLEYAVQFGHLLPAQSAFRLPMMIGGTSNHFRRLALQAVGGWDAWNVTEDADLGLRFARRGYRIGMCDSETLEDGPTSFKIWYRQRSRWIKGFMQTWLVLMRRPTQLLEDLGWSRFLAVQLSLGGAILAPLIHGPVFIYVLLALGLDSITLGPFGQALLLFGLVVGLLTDLLAPGKWSLSRLEACLTRPLYWPLHTIAALKALYELAYHPHFWAKTPHTPH